MKRTISLCIIVSVLLAGVTFSVFAQSYDPDDTTDSTASDYLELSPASPGSVTVNPDQWVGMFRDGGAGTSGTPVELGGGVDADTTYYLDGVPGDGHATGSSGGTEAITVAGGGRLRYSVLYKSGNQFQISVKAASDPTHEVYVTCNTSIHSDGGGGNLGTPRSMRLLTGADQWVVEDIGGSVDDTGSDFVANDGTDNYFAAYTGTNYEDIHNGDGVKVTYQVNDFTGTTENIEVQYTISSQ